MSAKIFVSILRWLIGATLIGLLIWDPFFLEPFIKRFWPEEEGLGFGNYFIAAGVLIGAVFLLKDLLVEVISAPLRNFFTGIFYPNEAGIPPPNYNLAQLYREQERYEESVEIYLGILKHHPQEVLAYIDGIRTAFDADQPGTAEKILSLSSRITAEEVRGHVAEIYRSAREEYDLRPIADPADAVEETTGNAGEEVDR